jgi:hypothetical protein
VTQGVIEVHNAIPRLLAFVSCAAAFIGAANAATTRTSFRGDSIFAFWNSNDVCLIRSINVTANRDSTGGPGKPTTYNTFIFFFEENVCANTATFATSNADSPQLSPHGAKSATIQGSATFDVVVIDLSGGNTTQYTQLATVNLRFDATEAPTHSRSNSTTISPAGMMSLHTNGTYAPSVGTGSIMLDGGTQLIAGPSDYADYGSTSSANLTIVHN